MSVKRLNPDWIDHDFIEEEHVRWQDHFNAKPHPTGAMIASLCRLITITIEGQGFDETTTREALGQAILFLAALRERSGSPLGPRTS